MSTIFICLPGGLFSPLAWPIAFALGVASRGPTLQFRIRTAPDPGGPQRLFCRHRFISPHGHPLFHVGRCRHGYRRASPNGWWTLPIPWWVGYTADLAWWRFLAAMFFAGISGGGGLRILRAVGSVSIPAMIRKGYKKKALPRPSRQAGGSIGVHYFRRPISHDYLRRHRRGFPSARCLWAGFVPRRAHWRRPL